MIALPLAPSVGARLLVKVLARRWRRLAAYDEAKHPRDDHGRWTDTPFDTTLPHYIGGDIPDQPRLPIFTTPDRTGAQWYKEQRGTPGKSQLHEVRITATRPFPVHSEADVKKLLPLLDEAKVAYDFQPSDTKRGWWLDVPEVAKHSPYEGSNPVDVAYIPKVRAVLIKHGYDAIQATDPLEHTHDIPITVLIKDPAQMKRVRTLGGEGSGNFGHEGRPGEVGGSEHGWANPKHQTAAEISGVTPPFPLKTYKAYHVTPRKNADDILQHGFDLSRVKPRWQNDYAISLSRGEKAARAYFSNTGQSLNEQKYAVLEVTVKGRLFKGSGFDTAEIGRVSSSREWTAQLIRQGLDGQDQGATIFVNNPKAIVSIREVTKPRALEYVEEQHPRDDHGRWSDKEGNDITPDPRLESDSAKGIAAMEALLPEAVKTATFQKNEDDEEPENAGTWDNLTGHAQEQVMQDFFEGWEGDVDTSDLDEDYMKELRDKNEDIIKETENETLSDLATAWPEKDLLPIPADPSAGEMHPVGFDVYTKLDPKSLVYGDDEGDGALLDLDELRTTSGEKLTDDQRIVVEKAWNDHYKENLDAEFDKRYEDSSYQDRETELRDQKMEEEWQHLDDDEKFAIAEKIGVSGNYKVAPVKPTPPEGMPLPSHWVTGVAVGSQEDVDYARTGAIAQQLTILRTNQLIKERGLQKQVNEWTGEDTNKLWTAWKSDSSQGDSLALQYAVSKELHGVNRLTDDEKGDAVWKANHHYESMDRLQAYARAQWETTQFVMSKAGEQEVGVYRALMWSKKDIEHTTHQPTDTSGRPIEVENPWYINLPDVYVQRAALQSTTGTLDVANQWNGVGHNPPDPQRVVLRIKAPRTSVFSLPVYGKNVINEHESVLLGAKDKWGWDLWKGTAPDLTRAPILHARAAETMRAAGTRLVVDLKDPPGTPHWLSKTDTHMLAWRGKQKQARQLSGYDESQHPRDEHGRWTDREQFEQKWPYGAEMDQFAKKYGDQRLKQDLQDFWANQRGTSHTAIPSYQFQVEVIQQGKKRVSKEQREAKRQGAEPAKQNLLAKLQQKYGYTEGDTVFDSETGKKGVVKWGRDGQPYVKTDEGQHYVGARWKKASERGAEYDESQHPRDDQGQWTDVAEVQISRKTGQPFTPERQQLIDRISRVVDVPSEAFRREVGTTSEEMLKEGLPASLKAAEDRIRHEPNEHSFILHDGEVVHYVGSDAKSHVDLAAFSTKRKDELGTDSDPLFDTVFTHNHPSNGAFSPNDAFVASSHRMKEIRAVVKDGAYSLTPDGDWPHPDYLHHVINVESESVHQAFEKLIKDKAMTPNEADSQHWKTVWPIVQKRINQEFRHDEAGGVKTKYGIVFRFEPK